MGAATTNMMVRSRSLLLLIAALASTLVAAEAADWKRGLDAIVTKLQTKDDATAPVEDANTIVPENPDPEVADESPSKLAASEVSTMLLEGNSTDACKKLADELCNEVEQSVKSSQQGIQALPDGAQCKYEGQEEVEQNKQEVVRTETESKEAADRAEEAAKATVDFGSFTLSSLDESMCVQFWEDKAYIAAKGNAEEAKEASREAKFAFESATERLQESILRAANKERECLCNVQRDYNNAYSTATKNIDEEAKAYAKCNHMKCYLENTPADNCEFVVPTVSPRKFQDVPDSCDQILNIQKDKASQIKATAAPLRQYDTLCGAKHGECDANQGLVCTADPGYCACPVGSNWDTLDNKCWLQNIQKDKASQIKATAAPLRQYDTLCGAKHGECDANQGLVCTADPGYCACPVGS